MITVQLTDREARIIAALVDHHATDMMAGFVEGTLTWTTQLTVDPELATDVVGVVSTWVSDCQSIRGQINKALRNAEPVSPVTVPGDEPTERDANNE